MNLGLEALESIEAPLSDFWSGFIAGVGVGIVVGGVIVLT